MSGTYVSDLKLIRREHFEEYRRSTGSDGGPKFKMVNC
jgi:hypothetical protein